MIDFLKKKKLLVIVALAYIFLFIFNIDKALEALSNSRYYLTEMLEILPVIFMLSVAIEALVPKELIMNHLGKNSGISGNILALILGSISAGPIYAAFPITKMLLKKGAGIGNVVIILSAWAVVKVPMLANEAKFLGPKFMVTRWFLTVIMIFVMGYFMNKLHYPQLTYLTTRSEKGLHINEDYCIGCGLCVKMAPLVYYKEGKKAKVKSLTNYTDLDKLIKETQSKCPAKAIEYNL